MFLLTNSSPSPATGEKEKIRSMHVPVNICVTIYAVQSDANSKTSHNKETVSYGNGIGRGADAGAASGQ